MQPQEEIIFRVEEDGEGGYTPQALGGSIFTQGDSLEELKETIRDAVECHFEGATGYLLTPKPPAQTPTQQTPKSLLSPPTRIIMLTFLKFNAITPYRDYNFKYY